MKINKLSIKSILILFILAVCTTLLFFIVNKDNSTQLNNNKINKEKINNEITSQKDNRQLVIGNKNAPVTIYEYIDYKCPSCATFHQNAYKEIKNQYIDTNKVKFIVRMYPYIGPDSGRSSRGAYCANEQGRFTEYHDAVFNLMWQDYYKNNDYKYQIEDVLTEDRLISIISKQSVDLDKFKECINSEEFNKLIDDDLLLAADDGIQGTPSFVIVSQKIVGPQSYNIFKSIIDIQLR